MWGAPIVLGGDRHDDALQVINGLYGEVGNPEERRRDTMERVLAEIRYLLDGREMTVGVWPQGNGILILNDMHELWALEGYVSIGHRKQCRCCDLPCTDLQTAARLFVEGRPFCTWCSETERTHDRPLTRVCRRCRQYGGDKTRDVYVWVDTCDSCGK